MANLLGAFLAVWAFTLAGGLVSCGGLASLTADSNISPLFGPYRLAWTAWSLVVYSLLVALYALAVGPFRHWRASVIANFAMISPILVYLTNEVLVAGSGLPGSNGSDTRANTTAAGVIMIIIGYYIMILLAALHDTDEAPAAHAASPKEVV